MNVTTSNVKMIGTTSGFESHKMVAYPSISVCSRRTGDEFRNKSDLSLFKRSLNLKRLVRYAVVYQQNGTEYRQMKITPGNDETENRDESL